MNALVKSQGRSIGFIFVCLCLQIGAVAQLKANFTATPLSGCSPLVVYFSDQSTDAPTSWRWDLGNGVISTLKNPSATYFNPGSYTIKLTVKNAAGSDSVVKEQYITVYANPVVDFDSPDTIGCFPKTALFNDKSIAGSGSISQWEWDFGDGTISSLQNPSHTYTSSGAFNVSLKVTNSFGCTRTLTKSRYVKISEGAKASFSVNSSGQCTAPATVRFNNTSIGTGASFIWDFGDGNRSFDKNPSQTYTANGSYTVTLVAISAQGCRDTLIKQNLLNIGANSSRFSMPDSICAGQPIAFTNASSPLPSAARWNFGDGTFSDSIHPLKAFNSAGIYTVKLINDFGNCKDSVWRRIVVTDKPKANFDAGTKLFCKSPANVQFESKSTNAVSYFWKFGDGTTATVANPVHTYYSLGNYSVTLIVTNASGCTDTIVKKDFIQIQKPKIVLKGLPQSGCAPLTVNPTANITSNQPVLSYLWKFGDGTSSAAPNPQHTYTTAGTYHITLVITTQSGCKDSVTMLNAVRAGNRPKAQFTALPGEVCNSNPVQFTDKSTGNVDEWHWNFGDDLSSTDQNPSHVFNGIGQFTVTLVALSNGCADTVTIKDAVNVLPPVSLFHLQQNCNDKYKVDFIDKSVGATSVEWDFGDGNKSTLRSPSHRYAAPGVYKVAFKTFNASCWNVNYKYVKIVDEKPRIVVDTNDICKGSTVNFSSTSVIDSNIRSWRWDVGDGIYTSSKFSHTYSNAGTYTVVLTVTDVNGCTSSDKIEINVFGPKADFSVSDPSACLKDNSIVFSNRSSTDGAHGIIKSVWNFGDESFDSTNTTSVQHHYPKVGNYSVSLLVTDDAGCSDKLTKKAAVVIAQPVANFYSADTVSCIGKDISFVNSSSATNAVYHWNFGDGVVSQNSAPVHTYNATGVYTVKLSVTDKYGCKDSLTKNDYVTISLPKAKFVVSDSVGNCPPLIVNFTNESTDYVDLKWDFGDGNTSILSNPVHYYNTAGIFYAKLIATGAGGCTDTAVQKIVVKGPSGSITYSPVSGCNPLTVNFTATTQNTTSFVWDFSDGNTFSGNGSTTAHEYINAGEFIPKIILTDASGCKVPIVGPDTIRVYQVTADFTSNSNRICEGSSIQFTNKTVSNDFITNYQWDFGDGSNSIESNPLHVYKQAGIYSVRLTAFTQNGCSSTVTFNNTIIVLAAPTVSIESINEACAGTPIGFKATNEGNTSILKWKWDLGNGNTVNDRIVPLQSYNKTGDYTITVVAIALNGCTDTATKSISIHPVPQTNAGTDEWICLGTETQLKATGADTYKWEATRSISCTTCPKPTVAPERSTTYVVTGYNQFGCSSKDSVLISVQQPFVLKVAVGDTVCQGEAVRLSASGADSYSWYPSTGIQIPNTATTIAVPQATTTYRVVGKDNHNCFTDTAEVFVKVWPIPAVNAGADQSMVVGNSLQLKTISSPDVTTWQWFGGGAMSCSTCSTTLVKPKQTTSYKVVVKNDGGCSASDEVTVNVICNNGNLFVPNAFSPNGDGMNDKFYPSGKGINRIKSLRVFNRWGEIVFERVDFTANDAAWGWDGKFKGELLSSDVFVWSCEVICENNEVLTFKGDVSLLR